MCFSNRTNPKIKIDRMRSANHPAEEDRLAFLRRIKILDTSHEQLFDDFVLLASTICQTPIAALSMVDEERQWFKASVGLEVSETSRELSFCSHAILEHDPTIINDATLDARFIDNELVVGDLKLRFYAGFPVTVEGYPLGALCVIDSTPRTLNQVQIDALNALARQLSICLESRLAKVRQEEIAEKLRQTESTLELSRRRFEELFQNMAVASYTTDTIGTIYEFNHRAEELFGYKSHEVSGKIDTDFLLASPDITSAIQARQQLIEGHSIRRQERRILNKDGVEIWTVFSAQPVHGLNEKITGSINVYHNIADRKQLERELSELNVVLKSLASTDELTQIANRRWIIEYLEKEFQAASRYDVSVILLDVDNFKQYNDTYGHPAGDEVLRTIAKLIEQTCRAGDRVGRFGGEEFIVILPRTSIVEADIVAERLRVAVESHNWPNRPVTASFGVATSKLRMQNTDQLISLADIRLYRAKDLGRNQVVSSVNQAKIDPNLDSNA
jgi:diguanylate cyclase (GGDEF)-like protein/PAS domain S-box-containing protein